MVERLDRHVDIAHFVLICVLGFCLDVRGIRIALYPLFVDIITDWMEIHAVLLF